MAILPEFLNQTQVGMLLRCQQQWWFWKTLGPKPPKAALTYGSAFHDGIGWDYASTLVLGQHQPVKEVIEVAVFGLENRKDATEWDTPFVEAKDHLPKMVEVFHAEVAMHVQPAAVEEKIELRFEGQSWRFRGYVDLREQDGTLVDTKTAARSWAEDRPQTELQPLFYSLAEPDQPSRFRFDIAVKSKQPKVQRLERVVTPEQKQGALALLAGAKSVMDSIQSGLAPALPTGYGGNLCSQRWCGYWHECQAQWKLPIKE